MENLRQFFVDPRIDKPWRNTLREKLRDPCACGIQIGGVSERQQAFLSWIRWELFISRGSHRSKGKANRLRKGLGRPAYPFSGSPRSHFWRVDSSHLLEFLSFTIAPLWTLLSWRYLRGKDRIGNPSLNLHLLCLIPKYLDLIFVGSVLWVLLEDGCAWMGFESTWALVLPLGFGPRLSPC